MKKELSSARNERDNIQYRLNLLKEDLELAVQRKEEAERKEKEEHESAEQARGQLVRGERGGGEVAGEGGKKEGKRWHCWWLFNLCNGSVLTGHTPENGSRTAGQSRETKDRPEEGKR